jgi:hypothetical protein
VDPSVKTVPTKNSEEVSQDDLFIPADYRPVDALKLVAGLRWSRTSSYLLTE